MRTFNRLLLAALLGLSACRGADDGDDGDADDAARVDASGRQADARVDARSDARLDARSGAPQDGRAPSVDAAEASREAGARFDAAPSDGGRDAAADGAAASDAASPRDGRLDGRLDSRLDARARDIATSCPSWMAAERDGGVPAAVTDAGAAQRRVLVRAGGAVRAVGDRYYAAWFPSSFYTAPRRRVLVALHGAASDPEAAWNDCKSILGSRAWGFVGLAWYDPMTKMHATPETIYARLKTIVDELAAPCDLNRAELFVTGVARGATATFPLVYLDRRGRRMFKAALPNAGAWKPGATPPAPLGAAVTRREKNLFVGTTWWMYCAADDAAEGWPACMAMEGAKALVLEQGGAVEALYQAPTGAFTATPAAIDAAFEFLESLP